MLVWHTWWDIKHLDWLQWAWCLTPKSVSLSALIKVKRKRLESLVWSVSYLTLMKKWIDLEFLCLLNVLSIKWGGKTCQVTLDLKEKAKVFFLCCCEFPWKPDMKTEIESLVCWMFSQRPGSHILPCSLTTRSDDGFLYYVALYCSNWTLFTVLFLYSWSKFISMARLTLQTWSTRTN